MPALSLDLDASACGRLRLTTSPLWELVVSLSLQLRSRETLAWPFDTWHRRVAARVRGECALLLQWLAESDGMLVPDLVLPVPDAMPNIDSQLAALGRLTPREVGDRLGRDHGCNLPRCWRELAGRHGRTWQWLIGELERYWHVALAESWSAAAAALDEEILSKAVALAVHGPDRVLGGLHERLRWDPPVLTVSGVQGRSYAVKDEPVVLVPMIFGRPMVRTENSAGAGVALSYQARGAAVLADRACESRAHPEAGADPLVALVGRGRSMVLRELQVPTTTTTLSRRLGLAASTVSAHLASLTASAVVQRRRAGGRVLYELTAAGAQLLSLRNPTAAS
jgi:DNA-binding transcriptional ArsR family regulator